VGEGGGGGGNYDDIKVLTELPITISMDSKPGGAPGKHFTHAS